MSAAYCEVKILSNSHVEGNIYLMTAAYNGKASAGQFFMLRTWGINEAPLLSRPISVHDFDEKSGIISFLYEEKGIGTSKLKAAKIGDLVFLTGPSGNGFNLEALQGKIALVGGGIGTAPLLYLAKKLNEKGVEVTCLLGFRDETYNISEFEKYSVVKIATDKGTFGHKGFVTELLCPEDYSAVCVCGPEIMMKKTAEICMAKGVTVYVSRESKMACGVGACLGCTCKTKNGGKSICKDGPVFEGGEIYDA